jgi:lipid-A-disaccharide synthase
MKWWQRSVKPLPEQFHRRVMIVAGEASGDHHGAAVAQALRNQDASVEIFGIGGVRMREVGVQTLVDAAEMAVVGLVEVLAHFPTIYRAFSVMAGILKSHPPDLLILIDYPDFNLRLAKVARANGVKVLYYISPQIWAWRAGRVHTIGRRVDRMAVVFPFEVPFYEQAGVPVTFVGHPLLESVVATTDRAALHKEFGLDAARPVVGLFPGSRRSEVRGLFPTILATAQLLQKRHPNIQFILPLASSLTRADLDPYLTEAGIAVTIVEGRPHAVMQVCDAIVTVSGTVTLEIALIGTPMVIVYKVSPLTYFVGKRLIQVDHVGLCNIVAGERVVPELIQHDAEPGRIAAELERFLFDPVAADAVRSKLTLIRAKLGTTGCAGRVAALAADLMDGTPAPREQKYV